MDRKTLTGFILIGAILLLWPSYLELVSPSEKTQEELIVPKQDLVEKYAEQKGVSQLEAKNETLGEIATSIVEIDAGLFVTKISNTGGGSFVSYELKDHLKEGESSLNLIDVNNPKNLSVSFIDQSGSVIVLDNNWILSSGSSTELNKNNPSSTLSYYTLYNGKRVTKNITINFNSYNVGVEVDLRNIKTESLDGKYSLSWYGGLPESEGKQDAMFMEGLVGQAGNIESFRVGSAGFFGSSDTSNIERESKKFVGQSDFVGYRTKYFGVFFVPQKTDVVEITKYPSVERAAVDISVSQDINFDKNTLFLGPLDYGLLIKQKTDSSLMRQCRQLELRLQAQVLLIQWKMQLKSKKELVFHALLDLHLLWVELVGELLITLMSLKLFVRKDLSYHLRMNF